MRREAAKASKSLKISTSSDEIMLPIYKGMPELFEYVIGLVERRPKRDIESIVTFHLLNEILGAAEFAIIHYFSSAISAQSKTAYKSDISVINENFQEVDKYLKSLRPIIYTFEWRILHNNTTQFDSEMFRNATNWINCLIDEYKCCKVSLKQPLLTVSAISFDGWLDTANGCFSSTLKQIDKRPPVVIKSAIPAADRSVLKKIQNDGLERVKKLRSLLASFATWLEANYSMSDITTIPHKSKIFYDAWLKDGGKWHKAWTKVSRVEQTHGTTRDIKLIMMLAD